MEKEPYEPYECYVTLVIGDRTTNDTGIPIRSVTVMASVPAWMPTRVVREVELGPFFDHEGLTEQVSWAITRLDNYWAGRHAKKD